jgi:ATP-binding cassette subfamily B protein
MVWRIALDAFTLGDLALFYQAYQRGQGLMQSLLSNLGQIYANSLFLSDLFAFLDQKPDVIDPPRPVAPPASLRAGIVLRDVSFRYPGHEQMVVENVNLTFRAGEITALVGENGAGKSTLVKLLCRFYDPLAGEIEWDGVDVRKFVAAEMRRRIAVLFQLPVAYCATAAENIALGDQASNPGREQVQAAARSARAEAIIARLPQGYDSLLGKLFAGGTELSVGEWQRMALARAFLRQAPVILLDEPTSFMDPWAEADWMQRFHRLAQGRTVIIITHRFTTARHADVIHVMQRGQVVESGSHADLVARDGLYARSWHTQVAGNQRDELATVGAGAIPSMS